LFPAGPDLVGQVVKDLTHGPAHVARIAGGFVWEDTFGVIPGRELPVSGVQITLLAALPMRMPYTVRDPVVPWTSVQSGMAIAWALEQIDTRRRYSIAELLAFLVIFPTRPFWDWQKRFTHWIPFEHSNDYVCSSFAATFDRAAGRYAFGSRDPHEIVPVDFVDSLAWGDAS
jgi:hypothetical protein